MPEPDVKTLSLEAAEEAQPALCEIMEKAITENGMERLDVSQDILIRFGLVLNVVQYESFNLGVRTGVGLVMKLMSDARPV